MSEYSDWHMIELSKCTEITAEKAWNYKQSEIDQLKAEKTGLEKRIDGVCDLLDRAEINHQHLLTKYQSTKLMEMGSSKRLSVIEALIESWCEKHMGGCSDYARGSLHSRQDCIDELEKALRGGHE